MEGGAGLTSHRPPRGCEGGGGSGCMLGCCGWIPARGRQGAPDAGHIVHRRVCSFTYPYQVRPKGPTPTPATPPHSLPLCRGPAWGLPCLLHASARVRPPRSARTCVRPAVGVQGEGYGTYGSPPPAHRCAMGCPSPSASANSRLSHAALPSNRAQAESAGPTWVGRRYPRAQSPRFPILCPPMPCCWAGQHRMLPICRGMEKGWSSPKRAPL